MIPFTRSLERTNLRSSKQLARTLGAGDAAILGVGDVYWGVYFVKDYILHLRIMFI